MIYGNKSEPDHLAEFKSYHGHGWLNQKVIRVFGLDLAQSDWSSNSKVSEWMPIQKPLKSGLKSQIILPIRRGGTLSLILPARGRLWAQILGKEQAKHTSSYLCRP